MALTRLGLNNISNSTIANVTALPSGMVSAPGLTTGKIVKVSHANPGNYSTTLTYSSTSLTPAAQITITAAATKIRTNSELLKIGLTVGMFGVVGSVIGGNFAFSYIPRDVLNITFGGFLVLVAINMFYSSK